MLTRLFLILFLVIPAKPAGQPARPSQGKAGIQIAKGEPRIGRYRAEAPAQAAASTQPTATVSDPNAVALASRALQSLAGGAALSDITLQANATYIAGSDEETGTATLVAHGNTQSLVTLNLSGGQRQEIRNGAAGVWVGPDGTPHAMATHNCFIDADWFFPAFSLAALASDSTLVISLVGQEVHDGVQVYHLTLLHNPSGQTPDVVSFIQQLSAVDFYLDASSLLPAAVAFNVHADNDANVNIPAEIRFAAYKSSNGVQAPTRIQKYLQNSLLLDLTVTNVAINSGVPASVFTLPNVPAGGAQ